MKELVFYDNDDLEMIVDKSTGEVFASQSAIARMICRPRDGGFRNFMARFSSIMAEIPTGSGIRHGQIYDESAIYEVFAKYKPELLIQCAKVGIRVYLYRLGGIVLQTENKVSKDNLSVQLIMSSLNELHNKIDKQETEIKLMQPFCERLAKIDTVLDNYCGLKEALDYLVSHLSDDNNNEFTLGEWLKEKNKTFVKTGDRIRIGKMINGWIKISCKTEIKTKGNSNHKLYCHAFEPLLNLALDYVMKY